MCVDCGEPSGAQLLRVDQVAVRRSVQPAEIPSCPPTLVNASEAARLCGIGRTTWYSLQAAGRVPAPIRLGRRVLWRIEELQDWIRAACPPLHQWKHLRQHKKGA